MDAFIVIIVIMFAFASIVRGLGAANRSGGQPPNRQTRSGDQSPPGLPPDLKSASLNRPAGMSRSARPAPSSPDWSDIVTMLTGEQAKRPPAPRETPDMEGVGTESQWGSGSITGRSILDDQPDTEGMSIKSTIDNGQPDYEGASIPGELSADVVAALPVKGAPGQVAAAAGVQAAAPVVPRRFASAAMRDAVVWSEILAKPKSLRRVAR